MKQRKAIEEIEIVFKTYNCIKNNNKECKVLKLLDERIGKQNKLIKNYKTRLSHNNEKIKNRFDDWDRGVIVTTILYGLAEIFNPNYIYYITTPIIYILLTIFTKPKNKR